jgi:spore germination protein YaaH
MRILRRGSRGTDVAEVQNRLIQLGYNPGSADGIFGSATETAVKRFQRDRGFAPDGIVGSLTYNAMFQSDYIIYTIKEGDTFNKLATRFKVSLDQIKSANPGVDPNQLRMGQKVNIPKRPKRHTVSAWVPYWKQEESMAVVRKHADLITTISPFWYGFNSTGDLIAYPNSEDSSVIQFARNNKIELIPLIANNFDKRLVSTVLNDPALRSRHIQNIVNKVTQMNYDGIEIDYENVPAEDKDLFVRFLRELKAALAPHNKKLYAAIQARTSAYESGSSAGHDYPGIGEAVDIVRLMLYDYSWDTPGPIAPVHWVRQVLDYAVSVIPRSKLEAGLPTYGYDWGRQRVGVSYEVAIRRAHQHRAEITEDAYNGPHFHYTADNGVEHQVWFTDAVNFASFIDLVNNYDIHGISIWYPGEDDPDIYYEIWARLD